MMTVRTWLYSTLTAPLFNGDTALHDLVGDRVFAKKSMTSSIEESPFVLFKLGNKTDEGFSETDKVVRQYLQIGVHDFSDELTGDYLRIDQILAALRLRLDEQVVPEEGILRVRYLETSQDLNDETLSTVFRYARYQLLVKE